MTALIVPAHSHKNKSKTKRAAFDNLVYAQVFNMVDAFDKEAEKSTDEERKIHFENYFAREAELSDEQQAILKTSARNFMSVFQAASYRDRLTLSVAYRSELRKLFGDDFSRFDNFVRSKIAPNFKIFRADNGDVVSGASGTSSISVNTSTHVLTGSSSTIFMFFARSPLTTCSVSSNMTGTNVSASASASNSCNQNLSVEMYSATYLPNSQYCANGTHVFANMTLSPSSSCLIMQADPTKIINTTFEQLQTGDLPIDANPNAGGGLRIFPDKKIPTEMTERRKIRVKAKIAANTANVKVYFRNFDFDDPSANAAPIDANGSAGDDNNGNVDGTTNTRAGQFSVSLSQYDCQISVGAAECFTDSNGEAIVYYTLTMQPGDNFSVVAGTDSVYLGGLTLAADGINLKDTSNIQTPVSRTSDITECYRSAVNACRTDMLTVWRRLHIEVDSMGNVNGNKVEGSFPAIGKVGTGQQTLPVIVSPALETDRFENGRIVIGSGSGSRSFRIINSNPNSTPPVNANTTDTVTINNTGTIFGIAAGQTFTLYDDDDMDNDDTNLNGDQGDDVPEPPDSLLKSTDTSCSVTVTSGCNTFAPAYVKPFYDLANSHENTVFAANTNVSVNPAMFDPPASEIQTFFQFNNVMYEADETFWTVYLNGAYQYDERADQDPNRGATLGIVDARNGQGALIFMETTRAAEIFGATGRPVTREHTVAHELGHLFNGRHEDYFPLGTTNPANAGLMATSISRTSGIFNDVTLNKIRGGEFVENGVTRRITHP